MSTAIELTINGEVRRFPFMESITDLLTQLDLNPQQVAVEVNRELVPRELHSQRTLADGDQIEVVTLVGGG